MELFQNLGRHSPLGSVCLRPHQLWLCALDRGALKRRAHLRAGAAVPGACSPAASIHSLPSPPSRAASSTARSAIICLPFENAPRRKAVRASDTRASLGPVTLNECNESNGPHSIFLTVSARLASATKQMAAPFSRNWTWTSRTTKTKTKEPPFIAWRDGSTRPPAPTRALS